MASSNISLTPPTFSGVNYQAWAVKMKTYFHGLGLWQYVEEDRAVPQLGGNPTLNQIRQYDEEVSKAPHALSHIHGAVSEDIFTRIMDCETAKEAWDKLKELYLGNERTKRMKILNLKREFSMQQMLETESIQDYADKLMRLVNKLRLLGEKFEDEQVVEKVLISLPERFESKISSLEDSRNLSQITLAELIHVLQAQEFRRMLRSEETIGGAFAAYQNSKRSSASGHDQTKRGKSKTCPHCDRSGHPPKWCWYRPDAQCKICNETGHTTNVCRNKRENNEQSVQVVTKEVEEEEYLEDAF